MIVEVIFAAGVTLAISSIIIQMRDLAQVLPILTSLGLFATPVIWPFASIPTSLPRRRRAPCPHVVVNGHTVHAHWVGASRSICRSSTFFNPLGPIINNARRTMLLGQSRNGS